GQHRRLVGSRRHGARRRDGQRHRDPGPRQAAVGGRAVGRRADPPRLEALDGQRQAGQGRRRRPGSEQGQDPRRLIPGSIRGAGPCVRIGPMELTWYGRTCVRIRGRDAVVVADPYQSVVGPTGRGISGDIVTFSHPDDRPLPRGKGKTSRDGKTLLPTSLDAAFVLDGPGEYEVKEVLVTGVRTYRDDARGAETGKQVAFVV